MRNRVFRKTMVADKTVFSLAFLIMVFFASNQSCMMANAPKETYTIPYIAEGQHEGIMRDMLEVSVEDERVVDAVSLAKTVGKQAGYELTGDNLDWYIYEGRKYPIKVRVCENPDYYLVQLHPLFSHFATEGSAGVTSLIVTSQELRIWIKKGPMKVVLILKGS